ncbi:MAG: hypothetical protein AAF961_18720, partial [Planctomycetota bacterium]
MSSSTNPNTDATGEPAVDAHVGGDAETVNFGPESQVRVAPDSHASEQFGHYTLLQEIARGGMGV